MQQQSSPKRIMEKRGSIIKQPNDSPTISPSQLIKMNSIDVQNQNPLEIKMFKVERQNPRTGNLVAEDHEDDLTYQGDIPKKLEQKQKGDFQKEYQMAKVDQQRDSYSPDKSMTNSLTTSAYPSIIKNFQFQQVPDFLTSPIQQQGIVQCAFQINKSGFNTFRPKFYFLKDNQCYLAAKKVGNKYLISADKENIERKSPQFVGQVSCKKNNQYYFYDTGLNPKRKKEPYRKCLGELCINAVPKANEPRQQCFKFNNDMNNEFVNRKPKWDPKLQTFILNFYERVKISSIKNFQIVLKDEIPEKIYLQFGKWDKHYFNLDIAAPFSPLIAFMIALSNYDQKLQV
ncbi:unnamed protein product [Paramecium primaurelia]|uniref:Tubby C-terminal domain-containing protein n=1 Tax=Paramecium primaurelia TaxID=5886 RepID=A0A8S1L5E4_PARPR|nr:unnamed protein product [Paramecium primaurelia]